MTWAKSSIIYVRILSVYNIAVTQRRAWAIWIGTLYVLSNAIDIDPFIIAHRGCSTMTMTGVSWADRLNTIAIYIYLVYVVRYTPLVSYRHKNTTAHSSFFLSIHNFLDRGYT